MSSIFSYLFLKLVAGIRYERAISSLSIVFLHRLSGGFVKATAFCCFISELGLYTQDTHRQIGARPFPRSW
jgi:hypothetical protein